MLPFGVLVPLGAQIRQVFAHSNDGSKMFKKTGVVHQLRWLCGQILSLDDLHPRHKEHRHGHCCMGGVTVALWFMWSHPERGGYLRVITAPLLYVQVSRVGWLDDHPAYKQFGLKHAISIRHQSMAVVWFICTTVPCHPFQLFSDTATFHPLLNACRSKPPGLVQIWSHRTTSHVMLEAVQVLKKNVEKCMATRLVSFPDNSAGRNIAIIADEMPALEDGGTNRWDSFFQRLSVVCSQFMPIWSWKVLETVWGIPPVWCIMLVVMRTCW